MKKRFLLLSICFLPLILISCANDSSDNSPSSSDIWASAKNTLNALDISYKLESTTQSARTAAALGEITEDNGTLNIEFHDYNDGTTGIGMNQRKGYTFNTLSGKESPTQCILEMTKNEIKDQITGLDFNILFTQEVVATYPINGDNFKITLKKFQITHTAGTTEAYIYSAVQVAKVSDSIQGGAYNCLLKCKENSVGTLDTELYMTTPAGTPVNRAEIEYSKFTRVSQNQKILKKYKTKADGPSWDYLTITSSGLSGYRYKNHGNKIDKSKINLQGNYCAAYEYDNGDNGNEEHYNLLISDKNGYVIKEYKFEESNFWYSLNFITDLTGYVVKRIDDNGNAHYYLYKDNSHQYELAQSYNHYDEIIVYYYSMREDIMTNNGFSCTVANAIQGLDTSVRNENVKNIDSSMVTLANDFDSTLPTMLSSWSGIITLN